MRIALAVIVAAGLASAPAVAQDTNELNTAAPVETVETTPGNAVSEPVLPDPNDPAVLPDPLAPVETDIPVTHRRERGFPWGLIGLIGLVGLLGRTRG